VALGLPGGTAHDRGRPRAGIPFLSEVARAAAAQRLYIMREADSAIVAFQGLVADYPGLPDAWFGLAEALYHFAGFADNSPRDAEPALRRLLTDDPTFAPLWEHRVDLAIYSDDGPEARRLLGSMHPNDRDRPGQEAAVTLAFGRSDERARVLASLEAGERTRISLIAAIFGHASFNLPLVDTVAALLVAPGRTHEDRGARRAVPARRAGRRGALERRSRGWRAGRRGRAARIPNRWIVQAYLAGWPAEQLARPMLATAARASGGGNGWPRSERSSDRQRKRGSACAGWCTRPSLPATLATSGGCAAESPRRCGTPMSRIRCRTRWPRRWRLASRCSRRDTARALAALGTVRAAPVQPFMVFYPLLSMAPERMLLAELNLTRGDTATARRWLDSFSNAWSFGDVLYARRVACVRRELGAARGPHVHDALAQCRRPSPDAEVFMSVNSALGSVAIIVDQIPHMFDNKLKV